MDRDMAYAMRGHLLDFEQMLDSYWGRKAFGDGRTADGWKTPFNMSGVIGLVLWDEFRDDEEYCRKLDDKPWYCDVIERARNKVECARECMRRGYEGEGDDELRIRLDNLAKWLDTRLESQYQRARYDRMLREEHDQEGKDGSS